MSLSRRSKPKHASMGEPVSVVGVGFSKWRVLLRVAAFVTVFVSAAGCLHAQLNPMLAAYDPTSGYRYENVSIGGNPEGLLLILAFSGGGTRAAAFSFGLLEGLRDVVYPVPDGTRRLLDDVDMISAVSGGSFTAAYYGLFRDAAFTNFPTVFLDRNIERMLIRRAVSPVNWMKLLSPGFTRIDLAAELYDEEVFQGKTFDDLLKMGKPYVILNASDMTLATRFEFTQNQFDLLCSDLAPEKIARGVAASSAFPILLTALTIRNYEGCGYRRPEGFETALQRKRTAPRRYETTRDLDSYRSDKGRTFIHLLDGGITDNLGLLGPYQALAGQDPDERFISLINSGKIRRVMVIIVNAMTKQRPDWDRYERPPGIVDMLNFVTSKPINALSLATVDLLHDLFIQQSEDQRARADCLRVLEAACPQAQFPFTLPSVDFHVIEISFDGLLDDEPLHRCLQEFPTTFSLPGAQVTLLRQAARKLLMESNTFRRAMASIANDWQPPAVVIDPGVQRNACGS